MNRNRAEVSLYLTAWGEGVTMSWSAKEHGGRRTPPSEALAHSPTFFGTSVIKHVKPLPPCTFAEAATINARSAS